MEQTIGDEVFERFRDLLYRVSGICLNHGKKALLVSRLAKRLRDLALPSFQDYYDRVMGDEDERTRMLDLVSTNKTDFFREPEHFAFLRRRVLPECGADRCIRIWSAACSSGEEPYTLAMTVHDAVPDPARWDCRILASDLSTRVLAQAMAGVYEAARVQGLAQDLVRRHFLVGRGPNAGLVKVKPHLAGLVTFRRINLMDERYPIKSPLDVIFCRNVMIYFDRPTQERLLARFHRHLRPGGYLFIGHSESLQWVEHLFRYVAPTVYQRAS